jgi:hypothetical protein
MSMVSDPEWLEVEGKEDEEGPRMELDVPKLRAISISVRGKRVLHKSLTEEEVEAGKNLDYQLMYEIESIVAEHGRHAIMTFKLKSGVKQRFRGNGSVLLHPMTKPTEWAQRLMRMDAYKEKRRLRKKKKLGEKKTSSQPMIKNEAEEV